MLCGSDPNELNNFEDCFGFRRVRYRRKPPGGLLLRKARLRKKRKR